MTIKLTGFEIKIDGGIDSYEPDFEALNTFNNDETDILAVQLTNEIRTFLSVYGLTASSITVNIKPQIEVNGADCI